MADIFYDIAKVYSATTGLNWMDGNWLCQAVSPAYVPDGAADIDYADIVAFAIGGPVPLGGQAVASDGTLSADSVVIVGLGSGIIIQAIVLYHLDAGTSFLAFYMDTGPGLPLTTTGADVTLDFNLTPANGSVYTF